MVKEIFRLFRAQIPFLPFKSFLFFFCFFFFLPVSPFSITIISALKITGGTNCFVKFTLWVSSFEQILWFGN